MTLGVLQLVMCMNVLVIIYVLLSNWFIVSCTCRSDAYSPSRLTSRHLTSCHL